MIEFKIVVILGCKHIVVISQREIYISLIWPEFALLDGSRDAYCLLKGLQIAICNLQASCPSI